MYYIYYENDLQKSNVLYLLLSILFAFIMDLFWIICYSVNWWSQDHYNQADNELESGIKQYTILISFVFFLFKIGLGAIYGYLYMGHEKI